MLVLLSSLSLWMSECPSGHLHLKTIVYFQIYWWQWRWQNYDGLSKTPFVLGLFLHADLLCIPCLLAVLLNSWSPRGLQNTNLTQCERGLKLLRSYAGSPLWPHQLFHTLVLVRLIISGLEFPPPCAQSVWQQIGGILYSKYSTDGFWTFPSLISHLFRPQTCCKYRALIRSLFSR